jgi:hypothetical protein
MPPSDATSSPGPADLAAAPGAAAAPLAEPGERLVFFEYCISLVFVTLRRPSRLYRLPPGPGRVWRGLPYAAVTLLLGWWGVPWGVVYTPLVLWTNLTGGREVTAEEMARYAGHSG